LGKKILRGPSSNRAKNIGTRPPGPPEINCKTPGRSVVTGRSGIPRVTSSSGLLAPPGRARLRVTSFRRLLPRPVPQSFTKRRSDPWETTPFVLARSTWADADAGAPTRPDPAGPRHGGAPRPRSPEVRLLVHPSRPRYVRRELVATQNVAPDALVRRQGNPLVFRELELPVPATAAAPPSLGKENLPRAPVSLRRHQARAAELSLPRGAIRSTGVLHHGMLRVLPPGNGPRPASRPSPFLKFINRPSCQGKKFAHPTGDGPTIWPATFTHVSDIDSRCRPRPSRDTTKGFPAPINLRQLFPRASVQNAVRKLGPRATRHPEPRCAPCRKAPPP